MHILISLGMVKVRYLDDGIEKSVPLGDISSKVCVFY